MGFLSLTKDLDLTGVKKIFESISLCVTIDILVEQISLKHLFRINAFKCLEEPELEVDLDNFKNELQRIHFLSPIDLNASKMTLKFDFIVCVCDKLLNDLWK